LTLAIGFAMALYLRPPVVVEPTPAPKSQQ
jgi:hypothetical protein